MCCALHSLSILTTHSMFGFFGVGVGDRFGEAVFLGDFGFAEVSASGRSVLQSRRVVEEVAHVLPAALHIVAALI